jgi:uncharacterized membrane protein YfcA
MSVRIIGYGLAILIGVSLGLIGGGGSILAVPILRYVLGMPAKEAIASSLIIVGAVSFLGVVPHWKLGNVNLKTAATFAPLAMAGSYLGAQLAGLPMVTDTVQLVTFGIVMLAAATLMIRGGSARKQSQRRLAQNLPQATPPSPHPQPHPSVPVTDPALAESAAPPASPPLDWVRLGAIAAEGLGVGVLTGFVGVGGGFLIVPALVLVGKTPMKEAIGTSLLLIGVNSVAGVAGYLGQVQIDWTVTGGMAIAAALGINVGARLSRVVDGKQLQQGFGYFVLAVATFVLIQR